MTQQNTPGTPSDLHELTGADLGIRRSLDGERLLGVFGQLVAPLGQSLPATSEVVLHDLSLLPNSIIAIHGNVTGREVGDPATDLLLEKLATKDEGDTHLNYESVLPDGRRLRSSTMIIRDLGGAPVAALCINTDTSAWQTVAMVAQAILGVDPAPQVGPSTSTGHPLPDAATNTPRTLAEEPPSGPVRQSEAFVRDIDELAEVILRRAIDEAGVPVELMQKRHKLEVVRQLHARGLFMLKDAIELAAGALHVTRFTIYNYLNEIQHDSDNTQDKDSQ